MIRLALLSFFVSCLALHGGDRTSPPRKGLAVWLDLADTSSLITHSRLGVTGITNKGETQGLAVPRESRGAWLIGNCLGGKPNLRFTGDSSYLLRGGLKGLEKATVFVVFRRNEELKGGSHWQRLLSSGSKKGLFIPLGKSTGVRAPDVLQQTFDRVEGEDLLIGAKGHTAKGNLRGDVAEILIYSRHFETEEEMKQVVNYLTSKWKFSIPQKDEWTRVGPLGKRISRVTDSLPLSDQTGAAGWGIFPELSDEFDGEELDEKKWWDHHPQWFGRYPGRFLPENVAVKGGQLQLTMRKDSSLPLETPVGQGYHNYSSALVMSRKPTVYGYFEIEAKPMASAGSSAFWLAGTAHDKEEDGTYHTEVDVFEIGGKSLERENLFHMNLHVFQSPGTKCHWSSASNWRAPFHMVDDFHVYGLEWSAEYLKYFVDGHLVRKVTNTHCHSPMAVLFDSETMFDWLGEPKESDLPSTYQIKYIRVWKNAATRVDWSGRYDVTTPYMGEEDTSITRYHRSRLNLK